MELVATVTGKSIISQILQPMAERAGREILDQCDFMVNIKREIRNLQNTLYLIQGVMQDVEAKQIENDNNCIHYRAWLWQLVDIGYETRDVLDDFFTFSASIRAKRASRSVNLNSSPFPFSLNYFNVGSSSSTVPVTFKLRSRLASDIRRVRKRLDELMRQNLIVSIVNSVGGPSGSERAPMPSRPKIGPYVNKQRNLFVGREEVKEKIMKKLLHPDDNDVHLVPIWGMGGVGKTTLAQFIYNDERVKENNYPSKNRRWLSVGEKKFNAGEIIASIIGQQPCTECIDVLQRKLVEKFKGKKFLIVLDDVWDIDSNQWSTLWDPLTCVGKGGVVIMTTRIREVITATNSPVLNYIEPLSDEDCWLIFKNHAFIDGKLDNNVDQKLKIGQEIVKKLKGLPLAAKVVGYSLLNEPDVKTWRKLIDSQEWKQMNNEDDIMHVLRWSYNHLPSNLKQCFSYCALFPKNHVFDEKVLIEMWMAHDYLIQNEAGGGEQRRPEHVGAQYFKELEYASLFQRVDNRYVMHDMIHDLVLLESKREFATANGSLSIDQMEKTRHITIISDDDYSKNLSLCKTKRIFTLYTHGWSYGRPQITFDKDIFVDVFKQLKSIRVLVLSHGKVTKIPDSISKLIHLRYLDVRKTSIRILPDSLCHLYNLQMLATPIDAVLPENIVNMTNLRYLRANLLTCKGIRNLTSLQELSSISVCMDDNIGEIGDMRQLRGKLTIKGLENVTRLHEAAQALMEEKLYIDELELEFESTIATDLLDVLRCPPNLIRLNIIGYTGLKPPALGEMSSLKHLYLCSLPGFKRLGEEFYGKGINGNVFFPSLESLELRDMKKWKEFGAIPISAVSFFPCLTELIIYDCPELTDINSVSCNVTTIKHLDISFCGKLTKMEFRSLASLRRLVVGYCDELISISGLVAVEELGIYDCKKLKSVSTNFQGLDSLEHLKVFCCPLLEPICEERSATSSSSSSTLLSSFRLPFLRKTLLSSSPWSKLQRLDIDNEFVFRSIFEQDLNSNIRSMYITENIKIVERLAEILKNNPLKLLEKLYIYDCIQLQLLPTGCLPHSLQHLGIHNCPQLQSLPADGLPPSLSQLTIQRSPLLYARCKDEFGLDWDKIKHIRWTNIG